MNREHIQVFAGDTPQRAVRVWGQGYEARRKGQFVNSKHPIAELTPYPVGSPDAASWTDGWIVAHAELVPSGVRFNGRKLPRPPYGHIV